MFNISIKKIILIITLFFSLNLIIFFSKYLTIDAKDNFNSLEYEDIIKKINVNDLQRLHDTEKFIINNHNIYGTLTALSLAKKYILYNKLDNALILLNNSLSYTKDENLKILLELNIAKIKIEKNENQQAIKILKTIQNHNWSNIIENMKGDIFININNKKEAIKSWENSFSTENSNISKDIIHMKINEIKE